MRMLLKATIPTELGNRAIKDGSFAKLMEATMANLKPQAAYFVAERGVAAPYFFRHARRFGHPRYRGATVRRAAR